MIWLTFSLLSFPSCFSSSKAAFPWKFGELQSWPSLYTTMCLCISCSTSFYIKAWNMEWFVIFLLLFSYSKGGQWHLSIDSIVWNGTGEICNTLHIRSTSIECIRIYHLSFDFLSRGTDLSSQIRTILHSSISFTLYVLIFHKLWIRRVWICFVSVILQVVFFLVNNSIYGAKI